MENYQANIDETNFLDLLLKFNEETKPLSPLKQN